MIAAILAILVLSSQNPERASNLGGFYEDLDINLNERMHSISAGLGVISDKAGKETAYYGMADDVSVRNLEGYADYIVCSHALYNSGGDIIDNVRYLHDHGTKVILDMAWWGLWPFPGVVDGWQDMYKEDVVYGMNATESVKYRIRGCLENIGPEYVYGITLGEEEGPPSGFPEEFVAWYLNLFYDWIKDEFPSIKVFQWPSPYTWVLDDAVSLKADGIVVDDYSQELDTIDTQARLLDEKFPEADLLFFVSAVENFGWFTAHTPTYLKQAVDTVLQYSEIVGFWVTDGIGNEGWEVNHWMFNVSLDICDQIHAYSTNTIYADTSWFPDQFGNDSVTESLDDWYASPWKDVSADPDLTISTSTDHVMGTSSVSLGRVNMGTKSFWWQPVTHIYGLPNYPTAGAYGVFNISGAARIRYFVKGVGWEDKTDPQVYISLEKYNSYFVDDRLDLPDIASLLNDGAWHEVVVELPLAPESYHNWDGYASQIRVVTSYSSGATPCSILFDGWEIQALDAGRVKNLTTTDDYTYIEAGTLYVEGDAVVERIFEGCEGWYYEYSGTGQIDFLIDGYWEVAPPPGDPVYEFLGGFRLYGGSFEYIQINAIPPLVRIDSPSYGDIVAGDVLVEVSASDISGISDVVFSMDDAETYTDYVAPYEWLWNTAAESDGLHILNVTATSNNGSINYDYCYITVDNTKPVVTIDQPESGVIVNNTCWITSIASDVSGIASVEFYLEGALLFADDSAPYEYLWNTTTFSDGEKNITCVAMDNVGNTGYSSILVTIDNSAPLLSIHSLSVWGNSGLMAVNTSDPSGIHRVEFYLDGVLQYIDYSYPYQWSWSGVTLPDGSYTFMAFSYDNLNHSSMASSGIQIDNTQPALSVTWALPGTTLAGAVDFEATASDDSGIAYVDFYLDGVLQFADYSAPYEWTWDTTLSSNGGHTIIVIAADRHGNSKQVSLNLNVDNAGPTLSVNSPANQTVLSGPAALTVRATVTDSAGIDTVLLSYYAGTLWTNISMVPSGSYFELTTPVFPQGTVVLFRVFANDSLGNHRWSDYYECEIMDLTPPSVDIDMVPSASTLSGFVQIVATATDSSGISMIILYIDDTPVAWLFSAPYSWSWDTALYSDGIHTVIAWANDTMNNSGFSEASATIDNSGPLVVINSPLDATIFSGPCSVSVLATAIDPAGIDIILLVYNTGAGWTNTSMVISGNQYEGTITNLQPGEIVDVRIYVNDTLGNTAWSTTNTYTIIDDTNPSIIVDLTPGSSPYSGDLFIEATAVDLSGISMVIFYIDGVPIAIDTVAPYEYTLDSSGLIDGVHILQAWTNDTWNNPNYLEVSIQTDNTGPASVINSPVNLTTIEGPIAISVLGTVQDEHGVDTIILGYFQEGVWTNITMIPSGFQYNGLLPVLQPGATVQLRIYANDSLGNWAVSSLSTIYIVDTTSPSISILLSPNWSLLAGSVEVLPSVTDVSTISTVLIYVDGVPITTLHAAPYHYLLNTNSIADGLHTLQVWANDTWNNSNYTELSFETDNSAPIISVTAPINGTVYDDPSRVNVEASISDSHSLSQVLVSYTTGGSWVIEPMVLYGSKYIWNSSLLMSGAVIKFIIFANDTVGNERITDLYECSVMDSSGPVIGEPSLSPKAPTSFDPVTVSVSVSDHSGVDTSILSYCVDSGPWINITMKLNSVYWANLPAMPTGSVISYRIYVNDTLSHWTSSPIYGYTVVPFDVLPPVIVDSIWIPTTPDDTQTVYVSLNATDPSGVTVVILSYHDGPSWHNVTMTLLSGQYVGNVPPLSFGTIVTLKVYACDGQENWGVTPLGSYNIVSSDLNGPEVLLLTWTPSDPTEEDSVEVYAELSDLSGIHNVLLCYGHGAIFANVTMTFNETGYVATIGAHPIGTQVSLCIYSCDSRDNWAEGEWTMYVVGPSDSTPPVISDVAWSPIEPFSNEFIRVNATISDENSIELVLLSYFDGSTWRNLTMVWMSSNPNLYVVHIPAIGVAGTIQIWVLAQDSKGNWGFTELMTIEVHEVPPITTPPTTTVPTTPPITIPPPDPLIIGLAVVGLPVGVVVGFLLSYLLKRGRGGK